jgi:hypothetical protein
MAEKLMEPLILVIIIAMGIFMLDALKRRRAEQAVEMGNDYLKVSRCRFMNRGRLFFVVLLLGFYFFLISGWFQWPPRWMERRVQRKEVFKRIESAGGWTRLVADTATILATNDWRGLDIHPRLDTNNILPSSMSVLDARAIEFRKWEGQSTALFRVYSTGRGRPQYWLYVITEGTEETAVDQIRQRWPGLTTVQRITNGVFEVY